MKNHGNDRRDSHNWLRGCDQQAGIFVVVEVIDVEIRSATNCAVEIHGAARGYLPILVE